LIWFRGSAAAHLNRYEQKDMKNILFLIAVTLLVGCTIAATQKTGTPKAVLVKENKIFVENVLYAEVLKVYPNQDACRGIAIHYLPSDRYEWVSPKGGLQFKDRRTGEVISDIPTIIRLWDQFQPDHQVLKNFRPAGGDGYFKMDWRYKVSISQDGQYVSYSESTEKSLFGSRKKTYKVIYYGDTP
jgi:hypothetical protein